MKIFKLSLWLCLDVWAPLHHPFTTSHSSAPPCSPTDPPSAPLYPVIPASLRTTTPTGTSPPIRPPCSTHSRRQPRPISPWVWPAWVSWTGGYPPAPLRPPPRPSLSRGTNGTERVSTPAPPRSFFTGIGRMAKTYLKIYIYCSRTLIEVKTLV